MKEFDDLLLIIIKYLFLLNAFICGYKDVFYLLIAVYFLEEIITYVRNKKIDFELNKISKKNIISIALIISLAFSICNHLI